MPTREGGPETMNASVSAWDAKRVEELRQLAIQAYKPEVGAGIPLKDALTPAVVLSLLDELEGVRCERDDMRAEIICLRAELAEYSAEFGP